MNILCKIFGHWYKDELLIFDGKISKCRRCNYRLCDGLFINADNPLEKAIHVDLTGKTILIRRKKSKSDSILSVQLGALFIPSSK